MKSSRFEEFVEAGRPYKLSRDGVAALVDGFLLSPERGSPVVGVSTSPAFERCLVDPVQLANALRWRALVTFFEHGSVSGSLAKLLPKLPVFGGYVRLWMPLLSRDANGADHPLFPIRDVTHAACVQRQIVIAVTHRPRSRHTPPPRASRRTPPRTSTNRSRMVRLCPSIRRGRIRTT